jgi:Zn-dependent M16 (insulinase) family peptidase
MVLENKAGMESGLVPSGHGYVNTRLRSAFGQPDWASEQMGGVSQLFFLRELAERMDKDWDGVLAKLHEVHDRLITREGLIANVTLDAKNWERLQPKLMDFVGSLPVRTMTSGDWPDGTEMASEGLTIPAQVNYVGKGVDLYALGHTVTGSWFAVQNYLHTVYLWERVRVQGGAYGGFCTFDVRSGAFTFLSYRDPNLLGTINNYDGAAAFLREHAPSEEEVTRTVIGVIGDMDDYMLPDAKGYTSMVRYLAKDTEEARQKLRDEVLSTTPQDFVKFADVLDDVNRHGRVVVMGSPQAVEKANNDKGGDWLKVLKVM